MKGTFFSFAFIANVIFCDVVLAHPADKFPCNEAIEGDCERSVVTGYFDAANPQEFVTVDPKGKRLESFILSTEAINYPDWWAVTIQEAHTWRTGEWLATQTAECVGEVRAYAKILNEAVPGYAQKNVLDPIIYEHQTRKPDGVTAEAAVTGECTWSVWEFVRDHDGAGTVADLIINAVTIKALCVAGSLEGETEPKWVTVSRSACETIRSNITRAETLLYVHFIPCLLDRLRQQVALNVAITPLPTGIPHTTVPFDDDIWFTLDLEKHWCGSFIE